MPARLLLAAVATLVACTATAAAHDLSVVSRAEAVTNGRHQIVLEPFSSATGIAVQEESWEGGLDALRARAKSAENSWDLIELDAEELAIGCGDGLLEKLDWSAIGGKDHYLALAVSDCGVGAVMTNTVLAWDRDKFPATPGWGEFWDIAKYPGKRGLARTVRGNLEIALIADGIAPADVYKVLASADGVDRAFRKLDQLKPYIVWWQTSAEAAHILGSGDVLMTSAPSNRIAVANRTEHRNFGVQWNASLSEMTSWAVLKGSPNLRPAHQLLYFAGTPAIQARLFALTGEAGLAKWANDGLPPELMAASPTNPANLSASLRVDVAFWHDNLPKLKQRFDAWLAAH
ncbi:MAG: extracellular solute-binding protein [Acetobacteraceae bacterium]|nr:extracellular solute-binding protein [Acetobacteraceae bacterium]